MLEATAILRIRTITAYQTDPTLTDAEITLLVDTYKVNDFSGLVPTDPDWEGTWDFNGAAHEGWLWKAAKVSEGYDFSSDVNSFSRDQLYQHCVDMAERWHKNKAGTLELGGLSEIAPVIGNLNDV